MQKKERVGILTFHRTTNFGSILQTYGLYKKMRDMGCECEVIDYRCPAIEIRENLKPKRNIFHIKELARRILIQPTLTKKSRRFEAFTKANMVLSVKYTPKTIHDANKMYAKFIVGSDIVWGRDITNDDYTYFLDFVSESNKKYSFSSSVGNYDAHGDEDKVGKLLADFKLISVREDDAVDWVKSISGKNAELVCDPTMLLTADEWKTLICPICKRKNYVLVYFNNNEGKCLRDALEYADKHNKKVVYINYGIPIRGVTNVKPTSLEEFFGLLCNAHRIYTASYHGMLFSIYFQRDFLFYTRDHKTRMLSLAKQLGIMHLCGDNSNSTSYNCVDWDSVEKKLDKFRRYSIDILRKMI